MDLEELNHRHCVASRGPKAVSTSLLKMAPRIRLVIVAAWLATIPKPKLTLLIAVCGDVLLVRISGGSARAKLSRV